MTSRLRTLMIGGALGTTALVGLSGAAAWAQAPEGTTPPAEAPEDAPPDLPGCRGERRAEADAELAERLGRSAEEVAAARQAARDAVVAELGEPARPESRPETDEEREALRAQMQQRHDLHRQKFAEALGVTVDELQAARLAIAEERLAAEVAAGELTQEEADARLEALRDGELPEGLPRGRGHGDRGDHGRGGGRGPGGPGGPGAHPGPEGD